MKNSWGSFSYGSTYTSPCSPLLCSTLPTRFRAKMKAWLIDFVLNYLINIFHQFQSYLKSMKNYLIHILISLNHSCIERLLSWKFMYFSNMKWIIFHQFQNLILYDKSFKVISVHFIWSSSPWDIYNSRTLKGLTENWERILPCDLVFITVKWISFPDSTGLTHTRKYSTKLQICVHYLSLRFQNVSQYNQYKLILKFPFYPRI